MLLMNTIGGVVPKLHGAAYDGNNEDLIKSLEHADINETDSRNKTPLHWAIEGGHIDTVKLLIENGANIEANKSNYDVLQFTPLYTASKMGRNDLISLLLESGASLEQTPIALATAVKYGHLETVELLISFGADINYKDYEGNTSILEAARSYYYPTTDKEGHFILNKDYIAIIELLIANGADVHSLNNDGYSSIIYASRFGSLEGVRIFADLGVSLDHKTKDNLTALQLSNERGKKEIVEFLLNNGASNVKE